MDGEHHTNTNTLAHKIAKLELIVHGDASVAGLDKRVDRIEQAIKSARWYLRALISGVAYLIAERLLMQ